MTTQPSIVAALIAAAACTLSCGGASQATAPEPPASRAGPPVAAAPPPTPAPPSRRDAARAEVARLTAIADQDPYLAAWSGPYGGVPPWDKLKVEAFPRSFETGLAL
ncbi:MAG TPA: hypothetical protein VFT22_02605, partial [Kofleriaceae bacterium]|nr:hypothetical protein [Kofleriaceae bacterium]